MNLDNHGSHKVSFFRPAIYVAVILFLFLTSIDLLVVALSHLGGDIVTSILYVTANPFVSLFIGLLATAIIQSSSTTTSIIVAMVASNSLDIYSAIPMLMGANIGTTLTSNIVSLSFITKRDEFRKAMSAATVHDQFNIFTTIILFPLQYYYNFLGKISLEVSSWISLSGTATGSGGNLLARLPLQTNFISNLIIELVDNYVVILVLSLVLLFTSIKLFSQVIYRLLIGMTRAHFERYVFSNIYKSFGWGALLTASMQSSSVTTSLVVPLVATDKVKLGNAFPFIIGANVGTTITALLAALFKTETAVSIAIAHLMFNCIGAMIFLPFPALRKLPVMTAEFLGSLVVRYRLISLLYIIIMFFLLPFAFIFLSKQ